MTKEALKLALDLAIMHHSDDGYAELRSKVRQLAKEALAPTSTLCEVQPEQEPVAWMIEDRDNRHFIFRMQKPEAIVGETLTPLYTTPPQLEQEPKKRCCNHDSDCAVHNGDALPVGPCNCTQTFVSSPDLGIVATVSYQLAVRELAKLVENNFGYMPRNDEWADKVLLVRDTFEAAHNIGVNT